MSVRFSIRRGAHKPPQDAAGGSAGLLAYEMGFDTVTKKLWINDSEGIGVIHPEAHNAELLDGVNITQIARTDINETFDQNVTVTGQLTATALRARYADIAEYYETDDTYEPGDILMVGDEFECQSADGSSPVMGVCSTAPAYLLNVNIDAEHFAPLALKGRVPVKITGDALRGDYIIVDSNEPGKGKAVSNLDGVDKEREYVGICISNSLDGICEVKI